MSKKIIALDFDHTLFDTDHFFHFDVYNRIRSFGIDEAVWIQSYRHASDRGYTLTTHAEEMATLIGDTFPFTEVEALLAEDFQDLSRYVYPDVVPFLTRAKANGYEVMLLSFGAKSWQNYKVTASGLLTYFDRILYTTIDNSKAKTLAQECENSEQVSMVDNKASELDAVAALLPHVATYWINRVPLEYMESSDGADLRRYLTARTYALRPGTLPHRACRSLDEVEL